MKLKFNWKSKERFGARFNNGVVAKVERPLYEFSLVVTRDTPDEYDQSPYFGKPHIHIFFAMKGENNIWLERKYAMRGWMKYDRKSRKESIEIFNRLEAMPDNDCFKNPEEGIKLIWPLLKK